MRLPASRPCHAAPCVLYPVRWWEHVYSSSASNCLHPHPHRVREAFLLSIVAMALTKAGALTLINATPFDWALRYQHADQMTEWDFPDQVKAGDVIGVAVDWDSKGNREDSTGEATYSFTTDTGHDAEFQLKASYDGSNQFHVLFENTSTFGNIPGSDYNLQWSEDAPNPFIFSGKQEASFASTNP